MDKDNYNKMKENARKYMLDYFDYVPVAQKFTDIMKNEVLKCRKLTA